MKTKSHRLLLPLLVLAAGFVVSCSKSTPADQKSAAIAAPAPGRLVEPTAQDAAWLAKARADYPLDRCVVSGDKFDGGKMGKPQDYIYREAGKPDRLVRFCCKDCLNDFNEDPAKYLKLIDSAAKPEMAGHQGNDMAMTYACPMHPEVTSMKAGDKCPTCGLALV